MKGSQAGAARFPGVLLSRGPLRACCYRSGSAAAARSRATDPAVTRAHPAAILGLRRCTAQATQGTWITAFGASTAIASTVSRRGQRRKPTPNAALAKMPPSQGPLRACCYRSGSAAAARSRAADPAATRAHPAAIRGLRRCTARATQGT